MTYTNVLIAVNDFTLNSPINTMSQQEQQPDSNIAIHFEMLMSKEEQERIGATSDRSEDIRVMRVLSEYDELQQQNAALESLCARQKEALECVKQNMVYQIGQRFVKTMLSGDEVDLIQKALAETPDSVKDRISELAASYRAKLITMEEREKFLVEKLESAEAKLAECEDQITGLKGLDIQNESIIAKLQEELAAAKKDLDKVYLTAANARHDLQYLCKGTNLTIIDKIDNALSICAGLPIQARE